MVITGINQFGPDRYDKLPGQLKVSFDGNTVINGSDVYDTVITKEQANQISESVKTWVNTMEGRYGSPGSSSPSSPSSPSGTRSGSGRRVCPGCNGSGKGSDQIVYEPNYTGYDNSRYCYECGKTGPAHSHRSAMCRTCYGKGYIE
jgi:DnaJ-class molecular chaperone